MKRIFLVIVLSINLNLIAQSREIKSFVFQNQEIAYSRIDYSKFGIAHFFITMYSMDSENDTLEQNAYNCMLKGNSIYHTLYFFIRIPNSIEDKETKEYLFSEFVKHLKSVEKLDQVNLYLTFENDYSELYQSEQEKKKNNDVKKTNLIRNNLFKCKYLSIR